MADWVIAIKEDTPTHWEIAAREGLWDLRRRRGIVSGDRLYFWQSGKNHHLVGRAIAQSAVREIASTETKPWVDSDPAVYKYRVDLAWPIDLEVRELPRNSRFTFHHQLNRAPLELSSDEAAALLDIYPEDPDLLQEPEDPAVQDTRQVLFSDAELAAHGVDQRRYMTELRVLREARADFRRRVLERDNGCLISGTQTSVVLEAAHIAPYRGHQTNDTRNGLTLRADIHRLFDMHLLTLEPGDGVLTVRTSPELIAPDYADLDLVRRPTPGSAESAPSIQLLRQHNESCAEWWSPSAQ